VQRLAVVDQILGQQAVDAAVRQLLGGCQLACWASAVPCCVVWLGRLGSRFVSNVMGGNGSDGCEGCNGLAGSSNGCNEMEGGYRDHWWAHVHFGCADGPIDGLRVGRLERFARQIASSLTDRIAKIAKSLNNDIKFRIAGICGHLDCSNDRGMSR
jgi:hypothetical protein